VYLTSGNGDIGLIQVIETKVNIIPGSGIPRNTAFGDSLVRVLSWRRSRVVGYGWLDITFANKALLRSTHFQAAWSRFRAPSSG
jgi:hypothetical protein